MLTHDIYRDSDFASCRITPIVRWVMPHGRKENPNELTAECNVNMWLAAVARA